MSKFHGVVAAIVLGSSLLSGTAWADDDKKTQQHWRGGPAWDRDRDGWRDDRGHGWDRSDGKRTGWGQRFDRDDFSRYVLSRDGYWRVPNVDRDRRGRVLGLFFGYLDVQGWGGGRDVEWQFRRFLDSLDQNRNGNVSRTELRRFEDWLNQQGRYGWR